MRAHRPAAARGRGPGRARRSAPTTSCCWPPRARTRPARWRRCAAPARSDRRSSACRTGSTTSGGAALFERLRRRWSCSRPPTWSRASCSPTARSRPGSSTSGATRAARRALRGDRRGAGRVALQLAAQPDIMRLKYAKLILNLGNAVEALCGPGERSDELIEQAAAEGRAALTAAGIAFEADEVDRPRGPLGADRRPGDRRPPARGSSSWQSLARGTGAIETDYLNGEIVLLGRLHGVPTPLNAALCELAARYAAPRRAGRASSTVDELLAVAGVSATAIRHRRAARPRSPRGPRPSCAAGRHLLAVGRRRGRRAGAGAVRRAAARRGRGSSGRRCSTPGHRARPGRRPSPGPAAPGDAARPRRHGDRPRRPPAAAPRRRPAVRHRHRRHEGRRGAGARRRPGAGRAIPRSSPSWRCCWSPTRSGGWRRSSTRTRFAGYDACLCFEAGERTPGRRGGGGRAPQGGRAR